MAGVMQTHAGDGEGFAMETAPLRLRSGQDYADCVPVHVVWEITLACNLRCAHCGSRAGRPRPNELNTAEALDLIRQLADLGTREITLIGGEAYLRRDWLELIAAISAAGMRCSLQTGGRALTDEKIARAAAAGLASAGVSLDGLAPFHDRVRGVPGSFAQALRALKAFRAHGIGSTVNTQITSQTSADLPALLEIIADAGATAWQIQLTVAMGEAADHPELLLQPYQLLEFMPLLADLYDAAKARGVRIIPGNNIGYFGPYEHKWRSITDVADHWRGCAAGQTSIGIEADGAIKGCPSLATSVFTGGNIREMTLEDMWRHSRELRFSRHRATEQLWGYCKSCYYADVCHAGCTWTTHSMFGRPGNNPYCHYRALDLAKSGLRERVRQVEAAPGKPFDRGLFELITETIDGEVVRVERPEDGFTLRDHALDAEVRAPGELAVCEACLEFVKSDEPACPHCGAQRVETLDRHASRTREVGAFVEDLRRRLEEYEQLLRP
jgi:Y-X(10)_GDL-associated radical SAM protein